MIENIETLEEEYLENHHKTKTKNFKALQILQKLSTKVVIISLMIS